MIYISRVVGPEYLGFSATTSAIMLLVSRLADGGLTALASQQLARDDEKLSTLLTLILPPKLVVSTILIVISLLLADFSNVDLRLKYFVKISVYMVVLEACTPSWVFVALGRINVASVIRVGQALLFAGAVFVLIKDQGDWKYLPHLAVFNSFVNFAMSVYFLWHFKLLTIDTDVFKQSYFERLKSVYKEAGHFLKADLSAYVYTTSDRLILYYFTSSSVVGIYEAAYKVINPFYAINAVITPTMFRDLAQAHVRGRIAPVMAKYVLVMSVFSIPLGFFLFAFSGDVIHQLYGAKFVESVPILQILGFVITFGFTSGIIVQPFSAWNMQKEYGNSLVWGNVVNTILNFVFIPMFGAVGAALATLAAKVTVTLVGYFYFVRETDYPILTDFLLFFAASVLSLAVVEVVGFVLPNPVALVFLYVVVYSGLLAYIFKIYFQDRLRQS